MPSRPIALILILGSSAMLAGCNEPSCSSEETLTTLHGIVDRHPEAFSFLEPTYKPENIVTTEKTSARTSCKATLVVFTTKDVLGKSEITTMPVTYTIERTDEGKLLVTAKQR